ncbi:MAG: heme ABC exporter ATP-binding protein CcmA [Myxococcaceae bacterium]
MSPESSTALDIQDVSKRFGPRWALARLTYQLAAGRSLLLTGHNGSGKSTLLRLIATASSPTAGKIIVYGHDSTERRDEVRRNVALVSHQSFLYEDLTAEQNLTILARLLGLADPKDAVAKVLDRVRMSVRAKNPVRQYSAGMRKRTAIARLLLKRPKLALFDEPFGELDPSGIDEMETIIREMKAAGTAVVLATHLIDQGISLTDERLHLEDGRLTLT